MRDVEADSYRITIEPGFTITGRRTTSRDICGTRQAVFRV
jgi:hypothetical protein